MRIETALVSSVEEKRRGVGETASTALVLPHDHERHEGALEPVGAVRE